MTDDAVLRYYSAALDEIWRLRAALALEARITEAHLNLKTFPKSRREYAEKQVRRMRAAARYGVHGRPYRTDRPHDEKTMLRDAGAAETLTRGAWEREVDRAAE